MISLAAFVFCALFAFSQAVWTPPQTLIPHTNCTFMYKPVRDSADNVHMLYTQRFEHTLMYAKISRSGVLLKSYAIDASADIRSSIDAADNTVVVAYQNIEQLFFRESKDGGDTWGKPVLVAQLDPNSTHYAYATVIIVKETGRIFYFYRKAVDENTFILAVTSRPPDSTVFSREYILPYENMETFDAQYIYSGKDLWLYVFVNVRGPNLVAGTLTFSLSTNSGIQWAAPKVIIDEVQTFIRPLAKLSDERIFLLYQSYHPFYESNTVIKYSRDQGDTWSPGYVAKEGPIEVNDLLTQSSFDLIGSGYLQVLTLFVQDGESDYHYSYWNVTEMELQKLDQPFSGNYSLGVAVSAIGTEHGFEVMAIIGSYVEGCSDGNLTLSIDTEKII